MLFFTFSAVIEHGARSRVNIPFRVGKGDDALEGKFVEEARKQGLDGLAGHRYCICFSSFKFTLFLLLLLFCSFVKNSANRLGSFYTPTPLA